MNETCREAMRDLTALLSLLCFGLGVGLGVFLVVFYASAPSLLGPLDHPIENRLMVIPVFVAFVILFSVGGVLGGAVWIIVMSRFLPKRTMYKWLTYGPQLKPLLSINLRLLDRMYGRWR